MAAVSLIGTVLGLVGTFVSASAAITQAEETRKASIAAENARRQQMQLDANRRRRAAVRESLVARATALSVSTNQGAQGSGPQGAMAQATATGNQNVQTAGAAETLGNRVFDANIAYANAVAKGQKAMAFGSLISSIGGALTSSAGTLGSLGGQSQYG